MPQATSRRVLFGRFAENLNKMRRRTFFADHKTRGVCDIRPRRAKRRTLFLTELIGQSESLLRRRL